MITKQINTNARKHEIKPTCPWPCLAMWYTIAAEVTVFPVPGGPWIKLIGFWRTLFTANTYQTSTNHFEQSSNKILHKCKVSPRMKMQNSDHYIFEKLGRFLDHYMDIIRPLEKAYWCSIMPILHLNKMHMVIGFSIHNLST